MITCQTCHQPIRATQSKVVVIGDEGEEYYHLDCLPKQPCDRCEYCPSSCEKFKTKNP
jgi:hypothetical protein